MGTFRLFKSTIFRDLKVNNVPIICDGEKGNYHSKLIFDSLGVKKKYDSFPKELDKTVFNKVELWYNFGIYQMMKIFINQRPNFSSDRPVDINFYGTTKYGRHSQAITDHRKGCMEQIKKLKRCKIDIKETRAAGKRRYATSLLNSKIGISPWGLGEKCYRDFEAIYSGCILIKPDTSFVLDWMDTYNLKNKLYVPCATNFSDLQEKVDYVKQNWKQLTDFRIEASKKLLTYWNGETIANHIAGVFKRCQKRIK